MNPDCIAIKKTSQIPPPKIKSMAGIAWSFKLIKNCIDINKTMRNKLLITILLFPVLKQRDKTNYFTRTVHYRICIL